MIAVISNDKAEDFFAVVGVVTTIIFVGALIVGALLWRGNGK